MSFIVLSSSCLEAMGVREPAPAVRGFAFVSAEEAQTRPPFAQPAHLLPLEASGPWLTADLQGLPFIYSLLSVYRFYFPANLKL